MNILFICSRNQWRSPTAEAIFKNRNGLQVRSAGTENSARIKVTEGMVSWADLIFAMEKKHKRRLQEKFPEATSGKEIIILDIPDDYQFMNEDLVRLLNLAVEPYLS